MTNAFTKCFAEAKQLEDTLFKHKGQAWKDYLRKKRGFITRVVTDNFKAGKHVTRSDAQKLWYKRVERQLNNINAEENKT